MEYQSPRNVSSGLAARGVSGAIAVFAVIVLNGCVTTAERAGDELAVEGDWRAAYDNYVAAAEGSGAGPRLESKLAEAGAKVQGFSFNAGQRAWGLKRLDEAQRAYQECLAIGPHPEAEERLELVDAAIERLSGLYEKAVACREQGNLLEAEKIAEQIVSEWTSNASYRFLFAEIERSRCKIERNYDKAKAAFEAKALSQCEALCSANQKLDTSSDWRALSEATQNAMRAAESCLAKAQEAYGMGEWSRAEAFALRVQETWSDNQEALRIYHASVARQAEDRGQWETAAFHYAEASNYPGGGDISMRQKACGEKARGELLMRLRQVRGLFDRQRQLAMATDSLENHTYAFSSLAEDWDELMALAENGDFPLQERVRDTARELIARGEDVLDRIYKERSIAGVVLGKPWLGTLKVSEETGRKGYGGLFNLRLKFSKESVSIARDWGTGFLREEEYSWELTQEGVKIRDYDYSPGCMEQSVELVLLEKQGNTFLEGGRSGIKQNSLTMAFEISLSAPGVVALRKRDAQPTVDEECVLCERCKGRGRVSITKSRRRSESGAVIGVVTEIDCPDCGGSGIASSSVRKSANRNSHNAPKRESARHEDTDDEVEEVLEDMRKEGTIPNDYSLKEGVRWLTRPVFEKLDSRDR